MFHFFKMSLFFYGFVAGRLGFVPNIQEKQQHHPTKATHDGA